jgi:hypothetical protein
MLNQNQILDLWKININILNMRSPSRISQSFILPLIILFILLLLKQFPFWSIVSILALYAVLVLILYLTLVKIKKKKYRQPYSYNLSMLIYQVYDFIVLITIVVFALSVGDDMLLRSMNLDQDKIKTMRISLLVIASVTVVLILLYSPTLTAQKIRRHSSPAQISRVQLSILVALNAFPGFAIFLSVILNRMNLLGNGLAIGGILIITMGYLLLTFLTNSFYEIVILSIYKWPFIQREKSVFNVHY